MANELADDGAGAAKGKVPSRATLCRAKEGDRAALREVLDAYRDDPKRLIREAWGNLPEVVEYTVTSELLGHNALTPHAARARMAEIRRDLEGPAPTPLERLLCERIALTWLDAHVAELLVDGEGQSLPAREHYARRYDRAHRRYLAALKALAQVRRLNLTAVQVNVTAPAPARASAGPPAALPGLPGLPGPEAG